MKKKLMATGLALILTLGVGGVTVSASGNEGNAGGVGARILGNGVPNLCSGDGPVRVPPPERCCASCSC